MGFYERHILPRMLNVMMGAKPITKQRLKVVPQASGRILEIGVGAGHNFSFYDPAKVEKLWALEPDPYIRKRAAKRAAECSFEIEFIDLPGEEIPLEDGTVDTIVTTFTLCSIPGINEALTGMRRVLKPGGRLMFCEHGSAPDPGISKWQRRIEPVWKKIAGGCHLTRNPPRFLEETGFSLEQLETMYLPNTPKFAGFNYWGVAKPR